LTVLGIISVLLVARFLGSHFGVVPVASIFIVMVISVQGLFIAALIYLAIKFIRSIFGLMILDGDLALFGFINILMIVSVGLIITSYGV